ncbi:MAG: DUF6364 family protein [Treponema sp.]|nr:DUF6364 family protein [Treponema sp.]
MYGTKLTLKLNIDSIANAKVYAAKHKTSLSSLVENFFTTLTSSEDSTTSQFTYSPIVQELSGIISAPEDFDYKEDYIKYIEDKYE